MSSFFSFGFSGDDIEDDHDHGIDAHGEPATPNHGVTQLSHAQSHSLEDLLATFPSQISYNILPISSYPDPTNGNVTILRLPRREVFDIKAQLMAEDEDDHARDDDNQTVNLISALERGDLNPGIYEGGFKTWECAIDLARYLSDEAVMSEILQGEGDLHIVELGTGMALPTLSLFSQILARSSNNPSSSEERRIHITLADYNLPVLSLATAPNLLLTWSQSQHVLLPSSPLASTDQDANLDRDLDISSLLLSALTSFLATHNITFTFISGSWSSDFVSLIKENIPSNLSPANTSTLILASETIYEPSSLPTFTSILHSLLLLQDHHHHHHHHPDTSNRTSSNSNSPRKQPSADRTKALIAAKQIYFGVGGGVPEFIHLARKEGLDVKQKWATDEAREGEGEREREQEEQKDDGKKRTGTGVERVILEARISIF